MHRDYTKLPLGYQLDDRKKIEKCPICGRPGVVFKSGEMVSVDHAPLEVFETAGGDQHGKYPIPRAHCFRSNRSR